MFDETFRQSTSDGTLFRNYLTDRGIYPGIKVDQGLEDVDGGQVTKGLDGLGERVDEYVSLGAQFAKWRAVARVGDGYGDAVIKENAKRLSEYALVCQERGLVPMVEPEVLIEGSHSAEETEGSLIETIAIVFDELKKNGAHIPGVILKTSMAVSGKDAENRADPDEVGERTVRALKTSVPDDAGGVVFLSGGQTPAEASANLNAIARLEPFPWQIAFSFSRALQEPVLTTWKGNDTERDEAQAEFLKRITINVAADAGGYGPGMENTAA